MFNGENDSGEFKLVIGNVLDGNEVVSQSDLIGAARIALLS